MSLVFIFSLLILEQNGIPSCFIQLNLPSYKLLFTLLFPYVSLILKLVPFRITSNVSCLIYQGKHKKEASYSIYSYKDYYAKPWKYKTILFNGLKFKVLIKSF